ncbi:hypothetical protein FHS89_000954 [Rubricella aquisinus]|uniref:Uncharacterized protein n=1 Tax=Rubricella aquisinus TaxID=2028108 RepID=A0A840WIK7_9RHOB|nr:hypothetical protein [Rubricella aquisinus]MBB5514948.1 hypothetical protein [Rubricella aquisinus]
MTDNGVKKIESDALFHLIMIRIHLESINRSLSAQRMREGPWLLHSCRQLQLDIRFIVEEIMLLSVAANKQAGEQITKAIRKEYRAGNMAKKLSSINSNYFPIAISVVETDEVGIDGRFELREGDHLTADQAVRFWSKAGDNLHAKPEIMSETSVREWFDQAMIFLNLTKSLFEAFEVDVSGKGMWIGGHLNYGEAKGPVLFHAAASKE